MVLTYSDLTPQKGTSMYPAYLLITALMAYHSNTAPQEPAREICIVLTPEILTLYNANTLRDVKRNFRFSHGTR